MVFFSFSRYWKHQSRCGFHQETGNFRHNISYTENFCRLLWLEAVDWKKSEQFQYIHPNSIRCEYDNFSIRPQLLAQNKFNRIFECSQYNWEELKWYDMIMWILLYIYFNDIIFAPYLLSSTLTGLLSDYGSLPWAVIKLITFHCQFDFIFLVCFFCVLIVAKIY